MTREEEISAITNALRLLLDGLVCAHASEDGEGLRHAISLLGESLNLVGGLAAMSTAYDALTIVDPAFADEADDDDWSAEVLDKAWSGIREWMA